MTPDNMAAGMGTSPEEPFRDEYSAENDLGGTVSGAAVQAQYIGSVVIQSPEYVEHSSSSDDETAGADEAEDEHDEAVKRAHGVGDTQEQARPALNSDAIIWWVHTTLLPLIERSPSNGNFWCPRWWEHAEALFRFHLMEKSWQVAVRSTDPGALSDWMLHTVDPHIAILLSPEGPFGQCLSPEQHFSSVKTRRLHAAAPDTIDLDQWKVNILREDSRPVVQWLDPKIINFDI